jgi:hypothetical protein
MLVDCFQGTCLLCDSLVDEIHCDKSVAARGSGIGQRLRRAKANEEELDVKENSVAIIW